MVGAIEALAPDIEAGLDRERLRDLLPSGAARNALDCALWDLEAKSKGVSVATLAGVGRLKPVVTAFTISLASPEEMARKAKEARKHPLLKLKLGGDGDEERLAAVREAVPDARLIVDANEAWSETNLDRMLEAAVATRVELIEQPLPAGADHILEWYERRVPICADESVHDRASLAKIAKRYDAVNIKLDKTGGLDRGARHSGRGASARAEDHGGLHGGDIARHGPCPDPGARRRLCRSRRTAAARARPRARADLRLGRSLSAAARALGVRLRRYKPSTPSRSPAPPSPIRQVRILDRLHRGDGIDRGNLDGASPHAAGR